jgi:hypothetical protein
MLRPRSILGLKVLCGKRLAVCAIRNTFSHSGLPLCSIDYTTTELQSLSCAMFSDITIKLFPDRQSFLSVPSELYNCVRNNEHRAVPLQSAVMIVERSNSPRGAPIISGILFAVVALRDSSASVSNIDKFHRRVYSMETIAKRI